MWTGKWLFVCLLVGALSPVSHKGLHQSWTQTSFYLQVINFTSHHTTRYVFWAYLYSVRSQHGNLHPTGWPILFCRPTHEPVLATANAGKNRERFWKNAGEWTARVKLSKEEIPGSKRSMYGYILTYPRLYTENLQALCSQQMELKFLRPQFPTAGYVKKAD